MDGAHSNQRTCRISRNAALSTLEKRASAKVIIQSDHPRTDSSCTRELMTLFCDFRFYFIRYVNACFVSSSPNITSPAANILRIYKEENKWNLHIHERTLYLVGKYEREINKSMLPLAGYTAVFRKRLWCLEGKLDQLLPLLQLLPQQ